VDAIESGDLTVLEELRDLLVAQDHQVLDQAVSLGLGDLARPDDRAVVEVELGLAPGHHDRRGRAVPGEGGGDSSGELDLRADGLGSALARGEYLIELVVVQARVGPDPAAIEAHRPDVAAP
jgi:hypothetical protein